MTTVDFVKMEGAGNDYVHVDAIRAAFPLARAAELARRWSDRHSGIGADGLIVLLRGERAPVRMAMWNADGSRGAMCGNGLRCLAKLASDHGHVSGDRFEVETDAGLRRVEITARRGDSAEVAAAMGAVRVERDDLHLLVAGRQLRCVRGDAGNPHAVVFVDRDPEQVPVVELGAAMQSLPQFPDGVNVEFVQVLDADTLRQRTFERGSGETMACGTGATAAAAAAWDRGLVRSPTVRVHLRGGTLCVRQLDGALVLEGPARTVFTGSVSLS